MLHAVARPNSLVNYATSLMSSKTSKRNTESVVPSRSARPAGELADLLLATYPKVRLSEMVLSADTLSRLQRVLLEYRQQTRLREHNLSARRKLLLVGPAGCGKTMTSRALAGELKLPHLTVQLHGLITKYMVMETAAKLHLIFEAMNNTRGVYLFDEFGCNRKRAAYWKRCRRDTSSPELILAVS